jgi:hypothetical protein
VALYNGIKSYGAAIEGIRAGAGVKGVEMDEMPTCVGSKNVCWIRMAVDRSGKRFLHGVVGVPAPPTGEQ